MGRTTSFARLTYAHAAKCLFVLFVCFTSVTTFSQNIAINADGSLPHKHAMLDIKSSNKGLLIPRMTSDARMQIPNTQGLMVYDINTNSFWYNTGKKWLSLAVAGVAERIADSAWLLTGNAGTVDNVNFLGTLDGVPLNIRVNNQRSGRIDHIKNNTFWGFLAGNNITTGNDNTGIGASALYGITTGYNNTAVGSNALQSNSTGYHNAAFGRFALMSNTGGFNNSAIGTGALFSNITGRENTAIGADALYNNTVGYLNTVAGFQAMYSNTTGPANTATGYKALYSNTQGAINTASGYESMFSNTGGSDNTATGFWSLRSNIIGSYNSAHGSGALRANTTGAYNSALGWAALEGNSTGGENTATGAVSLRLNSTGHSNVANGVAAMYSHGGGNYNVAVGYIALFEQQNASQNTVVGYRALESNRTGSNNTSLGALTNVTGPNLTNSTALGYAAVVNAPNKVRIGNAAVTVIEGQVPFTTPSDGRFKTQLQEDIKGLDFILQLRPVSYHFDVQQFDQQLRAQIPPPDISRIPDSLGFLKKNVSVDLQNDAGMMTAYDAASRIRRSGFIAQEVEQAAKRSGYNFSGLITPGNQQDYYSLSYDAFVVPLVKAVQEQQVLITDQRRALQEQSKQIADLRRELYEIKETLKRLR